MTKEWIATPEVADQVRNDDAMTRGWGFVTPSFGLRLQLLAMTGIMYLSANTLI